MRGVATPPDPDEAQALAHAAEAGRVSEQVATAVISAWIAKRAELSAGARLTENLAFDLGNSKLKGIVTAALPAIGAALDGFPADVAFFDLPAPVVVDLFAIAYRAIQEAEVACDERPEFVPLKKLPNGDGVPF